MKRNTALVRILGIAILMAVCLFAAAPVQAGTTVRVSVATDGSEGFGWSQEPKLSPDGRFVVFMSGSELVLEDTNGQADIYLHDQETGTTELISVSTAGEPGNGVSYGAAVSDDGRYVCFFSNAHNLVEPLSSHGQIIRRDRLTGVTELVSVNLNGNSGSGVAYTCDISGDGRYVVFDSFSNDLVEGDTNGQADVYVRDMVEGITERVSVKSDGTQGFGYSRHYPSISGDGRYVAFTTGSILTEGDVNGQDDVYVHDRATGITERASFSTNGPQGCYPWTECPYGQHPEISDDGRYVAFYTYAALIPEDTLSRVADIYVYDRETGVMERATVSSEGEQARRDSVEFDMSGNGRYIAFISYASNLVPGDTNGGSDAFLRDREAGTTELVSVSSEGVQGMGYAYTTGISRDGSTIAFDSTASTLVAGDTNGVPDIFVHVPMTMLPPLANAGADQTVHTGQTATLDGSASSDPNELYPLTYAWEIVSVPAGSTAALDDPAAPAPSFTADLPGSYAVRLLVTNTAGLESTPDDVLVSTFNSAPVAAAGEDQAVTVIGTTVLLDGSQSYDDDGDPITYFWNIVTAPAASTATLDDPTSATPSFTADVHGDYEVQLVVSDYWVSSPIDAVTISFSNVQPVADAGTNQSVVENDTVFLDGSGSHDANLDPLVYSWSIVAAPPGSLAVISSPDSVQPSFIADLPGDYVVSLIVNDGFVDSEPSNVSVLAVSTPDATVDLLQELVIEVNLLEDIQVKNDTMKNALTNKINAVIRMVDQGQYANALDKMQNDIAPKTDGCANGGAPDNNDWLTDCAGQGEVYPLVLAIIDLLTQLA